MAVIFRHQLSPAFFLDFLAFSLWLQGQGPFLMKPLKVASKY